MDLQESITVMDKMILDKMDDLEVYLDTLLRQKDIMQGIETYSDDKLDFADLLETYRLLVEEIERTQYEFQRLKSVYSVPGERGYEEEASSSIFSNQS